nr:selenide, water dikinase SelD [uncultured Blautia sp.]
MMKKKIQLTKLAPNCGCAAKVGPGTLAGVLGGLPVFCDPDLLVGTDTSDDAAVYRVSEELALIQTLDFFTPVADDPYDFGQIAAANALSDVYAMGGVPKTALNIVAFPKEMDVEILGEILRGGADKVLEAGAVLAGGHTIQDDTPKYGLSVTGFVDPGKFWKNYGAQTGDKLILTKPLGAGIVNTAIKADLASEKARSAVLESMKRLNRDACEIFKKFEIHACTDVTGFGLGGHGTEMAVASDKTIVINTEKLPVLPGVMEYASMGLIPGGAYRNREFAEKTGVRSEAELWREDLVFDPQTSGGLLASVKAGDVPEIMKRLEEAGLQAGVIGEVTERQEWTLVLK